MSAPVKFIVGSEEAFGWWQNAHPMDHGVHVESSKGALEHTVRGGDSVFVVSDGSGYDEAGAVLRSIQRTSVRREARSGNPAA